jgi:hypothetical protein
MPKVTPDQVRAKVNRIKEVIDDPEAAHGREDDLWAWVLKAIANDNCTDPAACAKEALKTQKLDFSRWYA